MRVPAELTALPVFGGDHSFQGYRGFGVLRPAEALMPAAFEARFGTAEQPIPKPAVQLPPYEEAVATTPANVVPIRADMERMADHIRLDAAGAQRLRGDRRRAAPARRQRARAAREPRQPRPKRNRRRSRLTISPPRAEASGATARRAKPVGPASRSHPHKRGRARPPTANERRRQVHPVAPRAAARDPRSAEGSHRASRRSRHRPARRASISPTATCTGACAK